MSYILASFIVLMIIVIEADALRSSSTSPLFLFPRPVIKNNDNNNSNQNNQLISRRRATATKSTTTTRVNALCSLTATGRDKRGIGSNATSIINITRKSATGAPVVDSALLRFMSQQKKISDVMYDGTGTTEDNLRKSASGAPVVDSALLRFISQQKKIPGTFFSVEDVSVEKRSVVVKPISMASSSFSASALPTNYQLRNVTSSFAVGNEEDGDGAREEEQEEEWVVKNTMLNAEETTTTISSIQLKPSPSPSSSPPSSSPTTVLQYSSQNIEHTLIQNAVQGNDELSDPTTAKLAADAIERYYIVRSARKNIRRFLKERDNLWSGAGAGGSSSDDNGNDSSSASSRHELETLAAFAAASSPAASLLLSYAEQQQKKGGETVDDLSPTFTFQDVIDVMKEYGLTINDICVLFTHSPNLALRVPRKSFLRIASKQEYTNIDVDAGVENHDHDEHEHDDMDHDESLEETLERSLKGLLQQTLGLRRYDARKVLRQCPTLVTVRGSKSAVQIMTMMTSMGVSTSSLKRDKAGLPTLLSRSPAGVFRLISFLSSTAARMPLKQIGPLLRRKIGQQLLDAVTPVPPLTISLGTTTTPSPEIDEIEIDRREVWYRNRAERKIQIERTYGEMTRTALLLQKQLGTQNLSKVIAAYPQVLLLDGEKQILPVARYLMGGLGIWKDDLSSLVQLYPTIFGKTIDELETIVSYLVDELGVDEDDLGHIFRSFPVLFTLDIHQDIEPVVSYLKTHCNVKDIGSFVTRLPPVLGYSVEKEIQPKWEFLKKMTLKPEYELNAFPAYFSYPFQRVIKTRFNYLASKNIFWFSSNCIDSVLRYGDIDFATKIALDDDEGVAYKAFGSQSSLRSCNKSSLQNDVRDRIEQPWRTTKRREMKHRRPSIQSQYQRIEGQSPPRTFRDSKKYLRREKAIAAAAATKLASGSSDEHLTKSQRSKAKAKKKAEKKAAEKEKANSIQGKTTSAMYNPLLTLAQQKKLLKNISLA